MDNTTATLSSPQENLPTRLNNVGDLKYVGQEGATQDPSGFAKFNSPQEGYGALLNDVQSKINRMPDKTLADFSNVYAPPSENNTAQYTANLANKLGVSPDTQLSSLQPKIGQLAEAIGGNEGYKDINSNPNPTPQEIQESDPNAPMSTFDKVLLGLGGGAAIAGTIAAGALTGGATEAAVPEEVAGLASAEAGGGSGVLGNIANGVKNAVTSIPSKIGGLIKSAVPFGIADEAVNNVLGNKTATATQNAGDEQANATAQAGQEEANATSQASEAQQIEQENLADEAETKKQIADSESGANALMQSISATPTGRVLAQDPKTQQTVSYMSQNGYLPDTSSGFNDYSGSLKKADQNIGDLSQGVEQILKEEGSKGQLSDAVQEAYQSVDKYVPIHEREAVKKYIDEIAQTYNSNGTGHISLAQMEQGKRENYQAVSKWDATRPSAKTSAHRNFAVGLKKTIEKNTQHKDLYGRVMKEEQKIFASKKIMQKLNGKKALEHKGFFRGVLKSYGKYVGTYIGDKIGGPIGAVVGTMVGDHLTKSVDKRFGKTYFESKAGKKLIELASKKSPHVAKTLKKELMKYGVKAEEMENREQMIKEKELKKSDYKEKKKGLLNQTSKKSEYEPYKKEGVIQFGKKAIPKKNKLVKGLPTIR